MSDPLQPVKCPNANTKMFAKEFLSVTDDKVYSWNSFSDYNTLFVYNRWSQQGELHVCPHNQTRKCAWSVLHGTVYHYCKDNIHGVFYKRAHTSENHTFYTPLMSLEESNCFTQQLMFSPNSLAALYFDRHTLFTRPGKSFFAIFEHNGRIFALCKADQKGDVDVYSSELSRQPDSYPLKLDFTISAQELVEADTATLSIGNNVFLAQLNQYRVYCHNVNMSTSIGPKGDRAQALPLGRRAIAFHGTMLYFTNGTQNVLFSKELLSYAEEADMSRLHPVQSPIFVCPKCVEKRTTPKIFPKCGHSICELCEDQTEDAVSFDHDRNTRILVCPKCKKQSELQIGEKLPRNWLVLEDNIKRTEFIESTEKQSALAKLTKSLQDLEKLNGSALVHLACLEAKCKSLREELNVNQEAMKSRVATLDEFDHMAKKDFNAECNELQKVINNKMQASTDLSENLSEELKHLNSLHL